MTSLQPIRYVLVPGFWLGAWAWDRVTPVLAAAGHDARPLTLPGLDDPSTPRGAITLADHVQAVVDVLAEQPDRPAVLVGHSGAGVVIYAATDRAPELVRRAVYVDSGPLPEGGAIEPALDPAAAELQFPSWTDLAAAGTSLAGLDEHDRAELRRRAVPHPAAPARTPLRLTNPGRLRVPVTLICSSFRPAQVRELATAGHPFFAELTRLDVTMLDLPTGHWPMLSRPAELANALLHSTDDDTDRSDRSR